jgi:hypothetical protein
MRVRAAASAGAGVRMGYRFFGRSVFEVLLGFGAGTLGGKSPLFSAWACGDEREA